MYNFDHKKIAVQPLFFLGLALWQFSRLLALSSLGTIENNLTLYVTMPRVIGLIIIIFSAFLNINVNEKISKAYFIFLIIAFLAINNIIFAHDNSFIDVLIMIVCASSFDLDNIIKKYFWIRIVCAGLIVFLSLRGILPNIISVRNGFLRYNLGFSWTSFAPFIFLFCVLYLIWDFNYKPKLITIVILLIINQVLYRFTNTKEPYFVTIFSILIWIIITKFVNVNGKYISRFIKSIGYIFPPFSFLLTYFFAKNAFSFPYLNRLLSGRLMLSYEGLHRFGIKFLGQIYKEQTNMLYYQSYFTIDSGVLRYAVHYGIISSILIIFMYILLINYFVKKHQNNRVIVLIIVFIVGLTDPWFLNLDFNIFVIYFSRLFMSPDINRNKVSKYAIEKDL